MAQSNYTNTGFKIHPTASQFFTEGPDSGSVVNLDFNVSLYESQSSFVNLSGRNYFYKIFSIQLKIISFHFSFRIYFFKFFLCNFNFRFI